MANAEQDWYRRLAEVEVRRIQTGEEIEKETAELVLTGIERLFEAGELNHTLEPRRYNVYENGLPETFKEAFANWFGHGLAPLYDATYDYNNSVQLFDFQIYSPDGSKVEISFRRDNARTPGRIDIEIESSQFDRRQVGRNGERREVSALDWGEITTLEIVTAINMLVDKSLRHSEQPTSPVATST